MVPTNEDGMSDEKRCHRADKCYAAERTDDDRLVGAPSNRPLCEVCEQSVAYALEDAPHLYVQLRNATLNRATGERTADLVHISRGSPLPLNGRALDLGEQLHWLLTTWEDEVRSIARLSYSEREGKREGRQITDAASLLAAHLTAWIAAPLTEFRLTRKADNGSFSYHLFEQSGVDAACALLTWRNTARNLPGLDTDAPKALRKYEQPCPACGVRAVTHRAGDDLMHCQSCGATQPYLPTLPRDDEEAERLREKWQSMQRDDRGPEQAVDGQDARAGRAAHTWTGDVA